VNRFNIVMTRYIAFRISVVSDRVSQNLYGFWPSRFDVLREEQVTRKHHTLILQQLQVIVIYDDQWGDQKDWLHVNNSLSFHALKYQVYIFFYESLCINIDTQVAMLIVVYPNNKK